jgi:hypothetical protein
MIPQTQERKVKNSSKVNLAISFAFHALLVIVLLYFAARQGLLGKKLEKISVQLIKEKPPEKPKPPEPKIEPPKVEPPKIVETPKAVEAPKSAPPVAAPPVVAPANTEVAAFDFGGGKTVETSSDPVQLYKGYIEYVMRSKWDRPEDMADDNFVAEVDVAVAHDGSLSDERWMKGSGNSRWDKTVKDVLAEVTKITRSPPTNFPPRVVIRFDVAEEATEPVLQ